MLKRESESIKELRLLMFHTAWRRLFRHVCNCTARFAYSLAYSCRELSPYEHSAAIGWKRKLNDFSRKDKENQRHKIGRPSLKEMFGEPESDDLEQE